MLCFSCVLCLIVLFCALFVLLEILQGKYLFIALRSLRGTFEHVATYLRIFHIFALRSPRGTFVHVALLSMWHLRTSFSTFAQYSLRTQT